MATPTTWGLITLVASLVAFTVAVGFQIRRIVDAPLPQLRAVETVATAIPIFVIIFALVYVTMSDMQPDSFTQPISRITGLYFTVTVFTTVGFGDIVARSDTAKAFVTAQMVLDLIILGGLVRAILGASRVGLERRRAEVNQRSRPIDDGLVAPEGRSDVDAEAPAVRDDVGEDQRQREEEQAEDEVAQEAMALAASDTRRPERQRDPDDQPDQSESEPASR